MPTVLQLAAYGSLVVIAGFGAIVGWKLLNGDINTDGLLNSFDDRGRRSSSPGRLQLLLFTIVVAIQYLTSVWKNPSAGALPAIPQSVLAALAGSQAVYLGGKALSTYLSVLRKSR